MPGDGRPIDPNAVMVVPGPAPVDPTHGMEEAMATAQGEAGDINDVLKDYHALQKPEDLAQKVIQIVKQTKDIMRSSGIQYRARLNHNLFYARSPNDFWEENLKPDGENGDSIYVSDNVLKNAIEHIMAMITSHRPVLDPIVKNSDKDANDIVKIAKAVVDSKLHEQRQINVANHATKMCPVLGSGFIHAYWDPFQGGPWSQPTLPQPGTPNVMRQMPNGQPVPQFFKGDICFEALTVLDVFYDLSSVSWDTDVDECVVRIYRNRYDSAVRYPQAASKIKEAPSRAALVRDEYLPSPTAYIASGVRTPSQQSKIEVWVYYHRRSISVPMGRYHVQLPDGTVLESGPMPDEFDFPVHRLCPDNVIGSAQGYAQVTSTGGLQEALNIGASALVTNMAAFAKRLILAQKGMEIEASDVTGDLKMLEVEFGPSGTPPIQPLDLMGDPKQIIDGLNWLVGQVEQDTGANSIVRGDPKGVTAGVAVNLYQSMAMQYASPLEAERGSALEWMANTIISSYRSHPDVERDVAIAGKQKRPMLQTFYGKDLTPVQKFVCDMGNPATRTLAGRYQLAQTIKQDGVPVTPEKLVRLVQTGDWDSATEAMTSQDDLVKAENEFLAMGQLVPVMPGDDPVVHIRGHLPVGWNPEVRFDQSKMEALNQHLNMHMAQMVNGDIFVKAAAGLLPMGPFPQPGETPVHGDAPSPGGVQPAQQAPLGAPTPPKGKGVAPGAKPDTGNGVPKPPRIPDLQRLHEP
jgi:hypothetical protein